jgi:hypothetical protein
LNQALASASVMVESAALIAVSSARLVLAFFFLKNAFTFDQHCSIGFRSGE